PERIYLEPAPYSPEGRLWCEDDVWPLEGDGPSGVEYVRADLVRRELDAPADRDALWRDYEEARDKVIDHASLWGAGAAEKAPLLLDALDAAVRALAAGDGQDSRAWLVAIAERLDALNRTIAAAHGLCIQCMERPRLEALRICGTCYRIGVPHGQDAA